MKICGIKDCNKKYKAHGLCDTHYQRYRKYGDSMVVNMRTKKPKYLNLRDKIVASIQIQPESTCWIWMGQTNKDGYGIISWATKQYLAHRLAYVEFVANIELDSHVCHSCDMPSCCNPDHLFLGTHNDNMRDMVQKNRSHKPIGILHPKAKLTEKDVVCIKELLRKGVNPKELGSKFKVCVSAIQKIRDGKNWKHIGAIQNG